MLIRKMGRVIALALPCLFSAAVVRANNADCLPGGITPAQVRSEGFSEQAQDFVFVCTGGTPAAQGLPIPRFNIELTFNTPVTSRVLAPGALEALLLLNEPTPAQQRVCGTPGDTVDVFGNCTIVATGNGNTEYDGSPGHPNVFQGKVAAPNSIVWPTGSCPGQRSRASDSLITATCGVSDPSLSSNRRPLRRGIPRALKNPFVAAQ